MEGNTGVKQSAEAIRHNGQGVTRKEHIRALWRWDLSFVEERVGRCQGWAKEYCKAVAQEYRKFIELCASTGSAQLGLSGPVDCFWHEHILFTQDYHRFCEKVAGFYIHHRPSPSKTAADGGSYQTTLRLLKRRFGRIDEAFWPCSSTDGCDSCTACDKAGPMAAGYRDGPAEYNRNVTVVGVG